MKGSGYYVDDDLVVIGNTMVFLGLYPLMLSALGLGNTKDGCIGIGRTA